MLLDVLQTTLAFAPVPEDLDDIDFSAPIIALSPPARDDQESEQEDP
jgi:hypothetical protein